MVETSYCNAGKGQLGQQSANICVCGLARCRYDRYRFPLSFASLTNLAANLSSESEISSSSLSHSL